MVFYPRIAVIKNYFEYDKNKQRKKKATLTYKLDSIQKIKNIHVNFPGTSNLPTCYTNSILTNGVETNDKKL